MGYSRDKLGKNSNCSHDIIDRIVPVALSALVDTFDREEQLFRYRLKRFGKGALAAGQAYRYTVIAALGLHEVERHGNRSPIDVESVVRNLIGHASEINNIGDVGLLIWLCSLSLPQEVSQVYRDLDIGSALTRYRDAGEEKTMELSWFLSGLAHMEIALKECPSGFSELAERTYQLLMRNYKGKGIFGHQNRRSIAGAVRGRIGNFADQMYAVYALSKYIEAYGSAQAHTIVVDCAKSLCRLQGPLGQWWWHYDSVTGKVIGRYPVFAVHQDGIAPMALFTLGEVTGIDFSKAIFKGLEWIAGNNELGCDLVDISRNAIWRSLYRKKHKMLWDKLLCFLGFSRKGDEYKNIQTNFECWPYHLGWVLYAFAGKRRLEAM